MVISLICHNFTVEYQANQLWNEFSTNLNSDNISTIKISGIKNVSLLDREKNVFIDILKKSTFFKSNRELVGSTGSIILIQYTNGSEYRIECLGGNLFELSYKELQFFIKNAELRNLLDTYSI